MSNPRNFIKKAESLRQQTTLLSGRQVLPGQSLPAQASLGQPPRIPVPAPAPMQMPAPMNMQKSTPEAMRTREVPRRAQPQPGLAPAFAPQMPTSEAQLAPERRPISPAPMGAMRPVAPMMPPARPQMVASEPSPAPEIQRKPERRLASQLAGGHATYSGLMRSHDRMSTRHLKDQG